MAYRRRKGGGEARRLRRKGQERREVQSALNKLEYAKQSETRKREKAKTSGGIIGTILGLGLSVTNPAALAAMMAGGTALGDASYVTKRSPVRGDKMTDVERAAESLREIERNMIFAESREVARSGAEAADIAHETISGGDLESGLMNFGTDWMKWYMTLASLDKAKFGGTEAIPASGDIAAIPATPGKSPLEWWEDEFPEWWKK